MKENFDPFIIPDIILALDTFPLRANGKTDRDALKAQLEIRVNVYQGSMPHDRPTSIYETLCLAYSEVLHIPAQQLDRSSSFTRQGGNSLMAIKLTKVMQQYGYPISVIHILKLDTIGRLESLNNVSSPALPEISSEELDSSSEEIPVTDVQKLFLNRSLESPKYCVLIGITIYTGDPAKTPTASELHDACVKVFHHTVFFRLASTWLNSLFRAWVG